MQKIIVNITTQTLILMDESTAKIIAQYDVSTALNGAGETENSGCTPRGKHIISDKFGDDLPINAVFVARSFTGEIYDADLATQFPDRDWILSRILWLDGCEYGKNKGTGCDSKARYIYIHGTPDTEPMGIAKSHGCVRMRNTDIIALFDAVAVGTVVEIIE